MLPAPPLRRLLLAALLALAAPGANANDAADADASAGTSPTSDATTTAPRADEVALAVVFVTPDTVLGENFPQASTLADWLRPILDGVRAALAEEDNPPGILVQITLRPEQAPLFELAGRPVLSERLAGEIRRVLAKTPDLRAPVSEVCLRIQTPGGTRSPLTEVATFVPRLFPPAEAELNRFIGADLATQYNGIRDWSRRYALPLLLHRAANVEARFAGVVGTARPIAALAPDAPIDVAALTYRRADFWRGVMEMAPGDELVASLPVFLHAAAGDIDQASTLLGILLSFSRGDTLSAHLLQEFAARLGPFRRQLNQEVQRGVAFHDEGKFAEAIAVHEKTLLAYPNSAWARYELFFSTVSRKGLDTPKKVKRANKLWVQTAPSIYRCNPLFTAQFGGTRGELLDRLVLHRLSNRPPEDFGERLGNFADAALRLEDYGTAALVYWSALCTTHKLKGLSFRDDTPVELDGKDVLVRFLYCLEKLGVPEWKSEFEGDFAPAFSQLEASLRAHRGQ